MGVGLIPHPLSYELPLSCVGLLKVEHAAGDSSLLKFIRTFCDPVPAMVTINVLKRVVPGVTHPAMYLNGPIGSITRKLV